MAGVSWSCTCWRAKQRVQLIEQLRRNGLARIELPFGDTHLAELPDGPLVLIAAGTGMGQMHSLIEHCRAQGFKHPVHLYWGVRRPEDFYQIEHWDEWERLPNLFLHKVVSDLCGWEGRCGLCMKPSAKTSPTSRRCTSTPVARRTWSTPPWMRWWTPAWMRIACAPTCSPTPRAVDNQAAHRKGVPLLITNFFPLIIWRGLLPGRLITFAILETLLPVRRKIE
jgi:hypothetical protein